MCTKSLTTLNITICNEKCYTTKKKTILIDLNETVKSYFLELWIHLVLLLWNVVSTPGNFLFIMNYLNKRLNKNSLERCRFQCYWKMTKPLTL